MSYYITVPQSPIYPQITLDDLLSGMTQLTPVRENLGNTRTYRTDDISVCRRLFNETRLIDVIQTLWSFNARHAALFDVPRQTLYRKFYIPKRSGGLREINAPEPPLMTALVELRGILETKCCASHHTAAFAYVKNRSTVDSVRRHQQNNSRWFLKVDFHDFFGSTTKEFTLRTLAQISPFNLILSHPSGMEALSKALDLCFLAGGLPQGTPISPMLTNLLMIPIDHELTNKLHRFEGQQFIYTRYADDMLISSFTDFDPVKAKTLIRTVLRSFDAPYTFKEEKTHYGSRAGSNWILGVMLNKDNNITVGHRNKKHFRAMVHSYIMDKKNGKAWELHDLQTFAGIYSYYRMVERDYIDKLIESINERNQVNFEALLRADLAA